MKKKLVSIALSLSMLVSMLPVTASAANTAAGFDFMSPVTYDLPVVTPGEFIGEDVDLPGVEGTDFIGELSGAMPEIREDGFLAEPTAPLKSFPASGKLMEEVGEPDAEATPIGTADELAAMTSGGNYVLTADIDLSGVEWKPIVGDNTTLDGQGHVITGLTTASDNSGLGLFSRANNLTVRNLVLKDFCIAALSGCYYAGALAGSASNINVENCTVENVQLTMDGSVTVTLGGLLGNVSGSTGTVRACCVTGVIQGTESADEESSYQHNIGGLAGKLAPTQFQLTDCLVDVDIDPPGVMNESEYNSNGVGGLVGVIKCTTAEILRCVYSGDIKGSERYVYSGLVNRIDGNVTATDCVFNGSLENAWGGMFGAGPAVMNNCRSEGEITKAILGSATAVGGLVGNRYGTLTATNCLAATDITVVECLEDGSRRHYIGGIAGNVTAQFTLTNCLSTGNITVNCETTSEVRSGGLVGTYDANDSTALRCENRGNIQGSMAGGLLGGVGNRTSVTLTDCKNSGSISGVGDMNSSSSIARSLGGMVGFGNCTMNNCVNTGSLTDTSLTGAYLGGMVGSCYGYGEAKFTNCRSTGTMAGNVVGGIQAGTDYSNFTAAFENCAVNVAAEGSTVGGLMAEGNGVAENCNIKLKADGLPTYLGGVFADTEEEATIRNCRVVLGAESATYAGGLVGNLDYPLSAINCIAELDVKGGLPYSYIGGLVGRASREAFLQESYATGSVSQEAVWGDRNWNWAGGLVGGGNKVTVARCWSDIALSGGDYMGGLVGSAKDITMYGSWASGTLTPSDEIEANVNYGQSGIGGLIGFGERIAMQDCCFVGEIGSTKADHLGSLVGQASEYYHGRIDCVMKNCYAAVDLTNTAGIYVGGLVGRAKMPVIRDCWYEGEIESNGYAGGILGYTENIAEIENCRTAGRVYGYTVGGIAGYGQGSFYSCISDMDASGYSAVGGIAGIASVVTMVDCHNTRRIYTNQANRTGGIVGGLNSSGSVFVNCSSKGATVIKELNKNHDFVGGIVGGTPNNAYTCNMENCRVLGDVLYSGMSTDGVPSVNAYVGGLMGQGSVSAESCIVKGSVSGYMSPKTLNNYHTDKIYIGGLAGSAGTLNVDNTCFSGSVSYTECYGVHETELLGKGTLNDGSVEIVLPERKTENYEVKVISFDPRTVTTTLLEGAEVKVDGVSMGYTDSFGVVGFDSKDFTSTGLVTISADQEGYFHAETVTYLADGGSTTIALTEKIPGELYIKSAYHIKDGTVTEVLSGNNKVRIPHLDEGYSNLIIGVDWNDLDEENRTIRLVGEKGASVVYLMEDGTGMAAFASLFAPDEEISVVASGTYNGEPVSQTQKLYVDVKEINTSVPTPVGDQEMGGSQVPGDKDSKSVLYFLNGVDIKVDMGDLGAFAHEVSFKNGVLKLKYSAEDKNKYKVGYFTNSSEKVSLSGEISIPITDLYEGEWSGKVTASINEGVRTSYSEKEVEKYNEGRPDTLKITYNFMIGAAPCFIETSLGIGGSAALEISGACGEPKVSGEIGVTGTAGFFGGLGGGASMKDTFEVKLGVYGDLKASLPMKYTYWEEPPFALNPKISGGLGAKAVIKAAIFDIQAKLKIGGFDWSKDGVVWSLLDKKYDAEGKLIEEDLGIEDIGGGGVGSQSLSLGDSSSGWTMLTRDYLADGGGFRTQDASGWSFSSTSGSNLRYENIAFGSESAMAVENGQLALYFTADDGTASGSNVADHTVLYRTVMQDDGSWSVPVALTSAEDGYPALPVAENGFVAWVNSEETADLDAMLSSTDIKVSDGTNVTTFEGGGYVYSPKLSVSADGTSARLSWLSDPEVTGENLLGGDAVLYYATYANGAWSSAYKVTTYGVPIYAEPDCTAGTIYYITENGDLYKSGSNAVLVSGFVKRSDLMGSVSATFNEIDQLVIKSGSTPWLMEDTEWTGSEAPVVAYDSASSTYYVFWAESDGIRYVHGNNTTWSEPLLLTGTTNAPMGLQTAVVNGTPVVSYYQSVITSSGERTDLYTVTVDPEGVDLVLAELDYNSEDMANTGYVTLQATAFNNGLADAEAVAVTVADESGTEVYNRTLAQAVPSGETAYLFPVFAADGKMHTYTMTVLPVVGGETVADADSADNAMEIEIGKMDAEIADTCFISEDGENIRLQAMVRNSGGVALDDLTVEIGTNDGDVLLTRSYVGEENAIPTGSYRQVILENIQANTCYTVTVRAGDEVLDTEMLIYEDPNATVLSANRVKVAQSGQASLTLVGRNLDVGGAKVVLALYQGNRMVAGGMDTVSDLEGSHDLSFHLSDTLSAGRYDYKLFFLSEDNSLTPVWRTSAGTALVD